METTNVEEAVKAAETVTKEAPKVVEKFGAKKEHEVRNEISSDQMESHNAQLLCYDKFSGRYFYSDMQTLRAAVNDLNMEFNADTRFSSGSDWIRNLQRSKDN